MVNDAGEGQRQSLTNQRLAIRCGRFVGSVAAVLMAAGGVQAKQELLPDDIQFVCAGQLSPSTCWDNGHAGNARLIDQCGDDRYITEGGAGAGVLVLRDPAYEDTYLVLPYVARVLVPEALDGRPALVLTAPAGGSLLRDGFERCRQWIR